MPFGTLSSSHCAAEVRGSCQNPRERRILLIQGIVALVEPFDSRRNVRAFVNGLRDLRIRKDDSSHADDDQSDDAEDAPPTLTEKGHSRMGHILP